MAYVYGNGDNDPILSWSRWDKSGREGWHETPLYTKPQTKEWISLTEYEIKGVLGLSESWVSEDCSIPDMIGFSRAVEAKLKEKNHVVSGK